MIQDERLQAVMDEARRLEADRVAEKAGRIKTKAIQISFTDAELKRLKDRAAADCLNLQNYIRKILSTYG